MQKKRLYLWFNGYENKKFLLAMKLCISFMLCFTLGLSASTVAQQQKVNLDLSNVSMKVLFNEIQKQTNLYFVFNTEQTQKLGTFSVQANDEAV